MVERTICGSPDGRCIMFGHCRLGCLFPVRPVYRVRAWRWPNEDGANRPANLVAIRHDDGWSLFDILHGKYLRPGSARLRPTWEALWGDSAIREVWA